MAEDAVWPSSGSNVVTDSYGFFQSVQVPFVVQAPYFSFDGYDVYRVYVETMNSDDFIHRVYGDAVNNASFSAPSGIYNNSFCLGSTSGGVPPPGFFFDGNNSSSFDSWVGIGLTQLVSVGEADVTIDETLSLPWSENFSLQSMPTGNYGSVDFSLEDADSEGGWRLDDLDASNGFAGDDNRVIVMQVTSPGTIVWTLNAEIYIHGDPNNVVLISQTFDGTSMGSVIIEGCTSSEACNYYDLATVDNGSCEFPATYYDCDDVCLLDVDGDGVCNELEIDGCTQALACNFDSSATEEDASCVFPEGCETCTGASDGSGTVVDNDSDDDGVCNADEVIGCEDSIACNFMVLATDSATCIYKDDICESCSGATDGTGTIVDNDSDNDEVCDLDEIEGCQDALACNYMSNATDATSDCSYTTGCEFCSGESDGTGLVMDGDADDDGVCDVDEVAGCQVSTACNYNALATDEDGSCDYCSCGTMTGLSPYTMTVEEHATDGIPGHTTYRMYIDMDHPNDFLSAVYGENTDMAFALSSTSTPNWYNHPLGVDFGSELNPAFFASVPDLEYDSWFTIGVDQMNPDVDVFFTAGPGNDFRVPFNAGEDILVDDAYGATFYTTRTCDLPPGTGAGSCDEDYPAIGGADGRVLVAQMTTTGEISGELSVQILQNGVYGAGVYHALHFAFSGEGSFSSADWSGAQSSNYQDCGCMDNTALNYDDDALWPEDSCIPTILGCMDSGACNYMSTATVDDGECVSATGCDECSGETDGNGIVVDNDSDDDGICDAAEVVGCQDVAACNYMTAATDAGDCVFMTVACDTCTGETDGSGTVVDNDSDDDGVCNDDEVVGCQDVAACNYMSTATDAGTCIFMAVACDTCTGETDGSGTVVDNDSDDDGVCNDDEVDGCQDETACNFMTTATDAATCIYRVDACDSCSGETDGSGTVVNNDSDDDDVCNDDEVVGCQDVTACNYMSAATDTGSCIFMIDACDSCSGATDGSGTVVNNDSDDDGVCDADEVVGCQDIAACNYMTAATNAGSCIYIIDVCDTCSGATDGSGTVVDHNSDDDGICDADEVLGCQDVAACNYMSAATDAGTCVYAAIPCETCTGSADDGSGTVQDNDADDDEVCDLDEVPGCQDANACNYNVGATDPGTACLYPTGCASCSGATDGSGTVVSNDSDGDGVCDADEVAGCQDIAACNYMWAATDPGVDCVLPVGCDACSGATDGTGTVVSNDEDGDGVCDGDEIVGCTNSEACNYNEVATEDGECFISGPYYDCAGSCVNDVDDNGICDEIDELLNNAEDDGFDSGFLFGMSLCDGEDFCGDGTVWSQEFQLCVEDTSCPGDLNGDLVIGTGDLLILLSEYGFFCD